MIGHSRYWYAYNLKRIQRFLLHTLGAFSFQYLLTASLPTTFTALPMYPPIGTAFILCYLLGNNALLGLFLGGFCAYLFKGWAMPALFLYLAADIGCGYAVARVSRTVFSSDLSVFISTREWINFIKVNAFIICLISSLFRICAVILNSAGSILSENTVYKFIDLWLSDLNAIVVFAGFFLSWLSVYIKRVKIRGNGFLIATALSYVLAMLFLAWFIVHQQWCADYFNVQQYTIIPVSLLLFMMLLFFLGLRKGLR